MTPRVHWQNSFVMLYSDRPADLPQKSFFSNHLNVFCYPAASHIAIMTMIMKLLMHLVACVLLTNFVAVGLPSKWQQGRDMSCPERASF
ncbi:hypothetical protein IF2G_07578 [Cordyceps javanica]|nr:hypothetical protein IF2G_07578 [Cordyceps javanica]